MEHVIDLILSMDQGKVVDFVQTAAPSTGTSGLTVIVTTMMVQSAQYVDVTNLKDLDL